MTKIKETPEEQKKRILINKAAETYLCDQEEGDNYDAYLKLLEASDKGDDNCAAADYVNVWQPLEHLTVAKMIEVIENAIVDNTEMPELYYDIDWALLKQQKKSLLKVIEDCDNVPVLEHLEGILVLIDSIQDDAVDNFGVDENLVFDFDDDEEDKSRWSADDDKKYDETKRFDDIDPSQRR